MADQGAVHICTERALHGKNLLSCEPRPGAGLQALRRRKNAGCDPGGVAQCSGKTGELFAACRHQNAAGNRRKERSCLFYIRDINTGLILCSCILSPSIRAFRAFRTFRIRIFSLQAKIRETRLLTGSPDFLRNKLCMGMCRIDGTGKMSFQHHLRHTDAVHPSRMNIHQGMGMQDFLSILCRHTDSTWQALGEQALRNCPSLSCTAENQNLSTLCFHLSKRTFSE